MKSASPVALSTFTGDPLVQEAASHVAQAALAATRSSARSAERAIGALLVSVCNMLRDVWIVAGEDPQFAALSVAEIDALLDEVCEHVRRPANN